MDVPQYFRPNVGRRSPEVPLRAAVRCLIRRRINGGVQIGHVERAVLEAPGITQAQIFGHRQPSPQRGCVQMKFVGACFRKALSFFDQSQLIELI